MFTNLWQRTSRPSLLQWFESPIQKVDTRDQCGRQQVGQTGKGVKAGASGGGNGWTEEMEAPLSNIQRQIAIPLQNESFQFNEIEICFRRILICFTKLPVNLILQHDPNETRGCQSARSCTRLQIDVKCLGEEWDTDSFPSVIKGSRPSESEPEAIRT